MAERAIRISRREENFAETADFGAKWRRYQIAFGRSELTATTTTRKENEGADVAETLATQRLC